MERIKGLVSIIIPNHNRDISGLLKTLKESPYQKFEVIEVNLGLERSAQRNIGIDRAKGEFLLFLDSDQEISIDFDLLDNCVWLCTASRMEPYAPFDALYIPEIIKAKGIFAVIRRWERGFYTGTAVDVVRFVRAEGCPRFDETLNGPEDSDWDRRVPGRREVAYFPLYHNDQISFFTYFKKKAYYAESMERFAKKWPNDKVLNWKWRCIKVFFENGKWIRVLLRPDLFICVMFIILIRGIIYYAKR
jgi:glycosyltransferase involved in cell wall biosynthesis